MLNANPKPAPAQTDIHNDNETPCVKLSLKPKMHPVVAAFLKREDALLDMVDAHGSPLNVIFPEIVRENIQSFQDVYTRNNIQGRIYFTTKPTKSQSVIKEAALCDVGVDVSSYNALKTTMGCGFAAERIECTGPKNKEYLTLALQQNVTINIDNFDEFDQILAIRKALNKREKTRIFMRVTGFESARLKFTSQDGTFGMHLKHAPQIIEKLKAHSDDFDFQGFSYHFVAMAAEQRIVALENILQLSIDAMKQGVDIKGINIGGGFDIQYAQSREDWLGYVDKIKDSLRHYGQAVTWNNGGLGFRNEGGLIKGAPAFMDHAKALTGAQEFESLIQTPLPSFGHMTMADVLNDCLLELYIEPGRAMVDGLGITIGRVNFRKESTHGETLVGLDMNRSNMHSTHQKLLTDPVVIHRSKDREPCENGLYYVGNLCLSYDMITYNKTFPALMPEADDLVVFINTAAYIMDFVESETLYQNTAAKVAVIQQGEGFRTFKDDTYNPITHKALRGAL
jgi:diaminopimelate decarboxylase